MTPTTSTGCYKHKGIYYCGECIVDVTSYSPPWPKVQKTNLWVEPEDHLNHLARRMRVNRDDAESVRRAGFPTIHPEPLLLPTFCGECLDWFTEHPITPTAEECDMNNDPNMTRHQNALLKPESDDEKLLADAYSLVGRIADAHPNDDIGNRALQHAATSALTLLEFPTGRIDQSFYDQGIRAMVTEAGGNAQEV